MPRQETWTNPDGLTQGYGRRTSDVLDPSDDVAPDLMCDVQAIRGNGFQGWSSPAEVIFDYNANGGDTKIPGGQYRGSFNATVSSVTINSAQGYDHHSSFRHLVINDGGNGRGQSAPIDPIRGRFIVSEEVDYWVSWVSFDETAVALAGWELFLQIHNNATPKTGYGITTNPAIAFERDGDNGFNIRLRSNGPNNSRPENFYNGFTYTPNSWMRFVINFRLSSFDSGGRGHLKVWTAQNATDPLEQVFVSPIMPIGFDYSVASVYDARVINLGPYHETFTPLRDIFIDKIKVSVDRRANEFNMDAKNWKQGQYIGRQGNS